MHRLFVVLEGELAGVIETRGTSVSLTYERRWADASGTYPLSLSLPFDGRSSSRTILNYLWGLLPDNSAVIDRWARTFRVTPRNPIPLLAHIGQDCAGAVQFASEENLDDILGAARREVTIDWLTQSQLEERITNLAQDAAAVRGVEGEGWFSLPGAQAKTALHWDEVGRRWGVPRGRTPTTHILKPVPNALDGFAENEHFCLELAREVGLPASETSWELIAGIPTFITKRYDRRFKAGRWHRVHQEDLCQALGVHPDKKYEAHGGPGHRAVMSELQLTDRSQEDGARWMRTACLNYLLASTDAHAKNVAILHARGEQRPLARLAPIYDIGSAWPYLRAIPYKKMKMAMQVGGHYRLHEVAPRHFHKLAVACGVNPAMVIDQLGELCALLPDAAASVAARIRRKGMNRGVITSIVDGIAGQVGRATAALARHSGA